tara:strand:+ start:157 stop:525 length:369 start_codon:yes stop_codon:yes gene_type:complete
MIWSIVPYLPIIFDFVDEMRRKIVFIVYCPAGVRDNSPHSIPIGQKPNGPTTKPVSFTSEHSAGNFIHVFGNSDNADDEFNGEITHGGISAVHGGMGAGRWSFRLDGSRVLAGSWLAFVQDG